VECDTGDRRPTARADWLRVCVIAAGTFAMVTSEFLPIGLLGTMAQDLGVSTGQAGLMVTAPGLVAAAAAPLLTGVAGAVDRRLLLMLLTALILTADLVVACSPTLYVVLAGRMLLGAALGGFWAIAAAAGRRLVTEADGNRATALVLGGISVGTVVGVPLGTLLGDLLGWRAAFMSVAGLTGLVLAALFALLPSLPGTRSGGAERLFAVVRIPVIRIAYSAIALAAAGHFVAYTYLQPFLSSRAHLDGGALTALLGGYGIAGVAGTWIGERLASRDVRRAFLVVALTMTGAIVLSILASGAVWPITIAVVLWGLAFGAMPVCAQIWIHQAAPSQFESGSALLVTVFQIAVAAGAFVGGRTLDDLGIEPAFALAASLTLCAALVCRVAGGRIAAE
jgi:predicted MFS family arabinose efflux permease